MQCLIHTEKLFEYYVQYKEEGKQITHEFHRLLSNVDSTEEGKTVSASSLKYEVGKYIIEERRSAYSLAPLKTMHRNS